MRSHTWKKHQGAYSAQNVRMGQKLRVNPVAPVGSEKNLGARKGGGFGDLYLVLYPAKMAPVPRSSQKQQTHRFMCIWEASSSTRSLIRSDFHDPQGVRKDIFALNKASAYETNVICRLLLEERRSYYPCDDSVRKITL